MRNIFRVFSMVSLAILMSCSGGGDGDGDSDSSSSSASDIVYSENSNTRLTGRNDSLNIDFSAVTNADGTIDISISLIGRNKLIRAKTDENGTFVSFEFLFLDGSIGAILNQEDGDILFELSGGIGSDLSLTSRTKQNNGYSNNLIGLNELANKLVTYLDYAGSSVAATAWVVGEATILGIFTEAESLCGITSYKGEKIGPASEGCLGRCGGGCKGIIDRYTMDCYEHDLCTRSDDGSIYGKCRGLFFKAEDDFLNGTVCGYNMETKSEFNPNVGDTTGGGTTTGGDTTGDDVATGGTADPGAPTAPSISAPPSATQNQSVNVTVTRGTDPDGDQVMVQCTASGSNYAVNPYESSYSDGGTDVTFPVTFSSAGTLTILCSSVDSNGNSSGTTSKNITVASPGGGGGNNSAPSSPSISAPSSATQNQSVSVTVSRGTDSDGDQVKVQCTASGSNYASSPYVSSFSGGGTSVSFSPTFSSTGTQSIWCYSVDTNGNTSSTTSRNIIINSSGGGGGNNAPTASISSPSNGSSYTQGNSIYFSGSGYDSEDGSLGGGSLVWTSNINGQIGTGNSFSKSNLSEGTHVITLKATDSNGATGFKIISIAVNSMSNGRITVGPASLNFGSVNVGSCYTAYFAIQHVLGTLAASGSVNTGSPFSISSGSSFNISNGQGHNVGVRFCPSSSGYFSGTATVSSSATFTGTSTVSLSGTGVGSSAPGNFSLSAYAYCNTSPPAAPAVMLSWGSSSGATSYDLHRNGSLYSPGISGTSFDNNWYVTAGQTYSYYVMAKNSAGSTQSSIATVYVPVNVCP